MKEQHYYGVPGWETLQGRFDVELGREPKLIFAMFDNGEALVVHKNGAKWYWVHSIEEPDQNVWHVWKPCEFKPSSVLRQKKQGGRLSWIPRSMEHAFHDWLSEHASKKKETA